MKTLTVREFRNNMAASLDRVDAGERILVHRNHRLYTIVPVTDNELDVSSELMAKIEEARREISEGHFVVCNTHEELTDLLDSL
ncbi:MAG: hypothetical protein MJY96_02420 [Bacteroidaceae bacterium]|nr:hypothetical protein [Candidatus Colenecus caballi]MCQ2071964.1 hypothetical protein [Bacteroidaceae bacterium]